MDGIVDHEVLLRKASAEVRAQQGEDIIFGVDDRAQHPIVLLEPHKALKLVYLPVQTFFHGVEGRDHRVSLPLDRARAQRKSQMQKAEQ